MTAPLPFDYARTTSREPASNSARPFRGRRMTWNEFYRERPDLRPDNDNDQREATAKSSEPDHANRHRNRGKNQWKNEI
jgi:hypothetical protein